MTGFGSAEGLIGNTRISVELRTVNHRFFSPNLKLPHSLSRWEAEIRELLRRHISRGHITLTVRIAEEPTAGNVVDEERFSGYVATLRALSLKYGLPGDVDLSTVMRMPGVVRDGTAEADLGSPAQLLTLLEEAVTTLSAMRRDEGGRLTAGMRARLDLMEAALDRIAERAPERITQQHERLRRAVEDLTKGLGVDAQRVAQEIAILADRLDVSEELDRFRAHIAAFRMTLAEASGEPVGKRLGFLLQEMLREANTTGSKANDPGMLTDVVAIKEELERIREQVENLE